MELEEMKILWGEMSMEIEKQKKITDKIIIRMTQTTYRDKIRKILIPELTGSAGCLAVALFILTNLQKLTTWYLLACGIISAAILILLPVLSIRAISTIRSVNISDNNYRQSLSQYSKGKIQFAFAQKMGFYFGAILMVTIMPVMVLLMDGKDPFTTNKLWLCYAVVFPFFYGFSRWVSRCYIKTVSDAENLLKELEG